jgi:uncharacterized membrane protein HdeD (DUF308 family)
MVMPAKKRKVPEKEPVSPKIITILGVLGILGLILIVAGIYALFALSTVLGVSLIFIGILTYVIFVVVEKRLKLI